LYAVIPDNGLGATDEGIDDGYRADENDTTRRLVLPNLDSSTSYAVNGLPRKYNGNKKKMTNILPTM